ncbi:MAG: HAMP domain-containing sensor histidine kinase [Pseudomonadota bacterium]
MRLGLTGKLLWWCLALVAIFGVTIGALIWRVQGLAEVSGDLVRVGYGNLSHSEDLIEDLFALIEAQRRFQILHKPEDLAAAQETWQRVGGSLAAWIEAEAEPDDAWRQVYQGWEASPAPALGAPVAEDQISAWIDILAGVQRQMRLGMARGLLDLEQASTDARRLGMIGLLLSCALALGGSLALAWYLGRSLGALHRGVAQVGAGGDYQPMNLTSGDELGGLARAFDSLAAQLSQEERLRAEFISTLSHEIRTPLTSIREAVNLVREGVLGPVGSRQEQFLGVAEGEVQRLAGLLERLMQVTSLEARDLEINPRPVAAADLLADAAQRLAAAALARRVEIACAPGPALMVLADPDQVRQVLLNLVGNALKFSPEAGRLELAASAQGHEAVFAVADQGPGIPAEEQAYVFQKFYRGRAVKDRVDGVGLGLNLSQRIITAHGGRMWLTSAPGAGSTFYFSLPLAGAGAEAAA